MQSSTQTITAISRTRRASKTSEALRGRLRRHCAIALNKGVSRSFLYKQQQKGNQALEREFNQSKDESNILYWIRVTQNWIFQVILGLIFICHSSYRGVVEFLAGFIRLSHKRC